MGNKEITVALAGNPNVGKSTVFNALTGLKQHTGNWTGKTVELAKGKLLKDGLRYNIVDIPGTYSLKPHSREEEIAGEYICFGGADKVIIICDATKLERNLSFALQIMETGADCALCVNFMDEARKRKMVVDLPLLSKELGISVSGVSAKNQNGLSEVVEMISEEKRQATFRIRYCEELEKAAELLIPVLRRNGLKGDKGRWLAFRILENEKTVVNYLENEYPEMMREITSAREKALTILKQNGIEINEISAIISKTLFKYSEEIAGRVVIRKGRDNVSCRLDKIFTRGASAYAALLILLFIIFFITVKGANIPSMILSELFFYLEGLLHKIAKAASVPGFLEGILVSGGFRVMGWVVAVMLPPMAIFFPCFTLLEDWGFLPRVAYVLDSGFKKAHTCGKQALTTCMGYGCNCVGISGARIIDSKRERLIAMITNSLTLCNGRFPAIITVVTIFFAGSGGVLTALMLALIVAFSLGLTLLVSKMLSVTVLRGEPSHYILELPPFRRPQLSRVIVSSVINRTAVVLVRAVAVAFPAGMIIWLLANVELGGFSILEALCRSLELPGRLLGLDGETLCAFFLGIPANEIVLPIALMAYTGAGDLSAVESVEIINGILTTNGWSVATALCFIAFSVAHFPCATALVTFYKETKSVKWTAFAFFVPLATGTVLCIFLSFFSRIIIN